MLGRPGGGSRMHFVGQLKRREFITLIGGTALWWPQTTHAQQGVSVARVGVLGPSLDSVPAMRDAYPSFPAELRKLGFEQGRNLLVRYRAVEPGQAVAAVSELIEWKSDVLFVQAVEFN